MKKANRATAEPDPLDAFAEESAPVTAATQAKLPVTRNSITVTTGGTLVLLGCLSVAGVVAMGALAYLQASRRQTAAPGVMQRVLAEAPGTAAFQSEPAGAIVTIDGERRGTTPLRLSLAPGRHVADITAGSDHRSIPFEVGARSTVSQYVEFASVAAAATGRLDITSEPSGAPVSVDGIAKGTTPLTLAAIAPGPHSIAIGQGESLVRRSVMIAAGATSSVMVSGAPAGLAAGWAVLKAPFEMQVLEGDQLIGTTSANRLMLPAGKHDLTVANPAFNFKSTVSVQVSAGKTSTANISVPNGSLSLNALPWAEVSVDGQPAGTTPLGNLAISVGAHEVVWRHPQLGERRQTVTVKAQVPTRVAVDFNKQP